MAFNTSVNRTGDLFNSSEPNFPQLSKAQTTELTAWIVTQLTLTYLGALCNAIVLAVTWPKGQRKFGINLIIFHFVAINFLLCCVNLPLSVFTVVVKRAGYPITRACSYIHSIFAVAVYALNWSDASLSLNRCVALLLPHHYRAWTSWKIQLSIIAGTWTFSIAALIPVLCHVRDSYMFATAMGQCVLHYGTDQFGLFLQSILIYIPYAITGTSCMLILLKSLALALQQRRNVLPTLGAAELKRQLHRLRMARIVMLIFLWSVACSAAGWIAASVASNIYIRSPLSALWMRSPYPLQFGFMPVSFSTDCLCMNYVCGELHNRRHQENFAITFVVGDCSAFCYSPTPPTDFDCVNYWTEQRYHRHQVGLALRETSDHYLI